jgi:hypothetical protein
MSRLVVRKLEEPQPDRPIPALPTFGGLVKISIERTFVGLRLRSGTNQDDEYELVYAVPQRGMLTASLRADPETVIRPENELPQNVELRTLLRIRRDSEGVFTVFLSNQLPKAVNVENDSVVNDLKAAITRARRAHEVSVTIVEA